MRLRLPVHEPRHADLKRMLQPDYGRFLTYGLFHLSLGSGPSHLGYTGTRLALP